MDKRKSKTDQLQAGVCNVAKVQRSLHDAIVQRETEIRKLRTSLEAAELVDAKETDQVLRKVRAVPDTSGRFQQILEAQKLLDEIGLLHAMTSAVSGLSVDGGSSETSSDATAQHVTSSAGMASTVEAATQTDQQTGESRANSATTLGLTTSPAPAARGANKQSVETQTSAECGPITTQPPVAPRIQYSRPYSRRAAQC